MKIFGGNANRYLTEEVAKSLNVPLSLIDVHVFPDGERRIRIHDRVVGQKVAVIQPASTPVDTNYMELFLIVDALKRSGAEHVTAVVPYFGYQRQDHVFRDGEAVSLEVVIKILEMLKIDKLVSFDMHSIKIPDMFHIPVAHLSALPLFAHEITRRKWHTKDTLLVSPDMGGIARIKKLSELLGNMDYIALEKNRDLSTGAITVDDIDEDSIKGKKRAILVDDMISSGNTILLGASKLHLLGIEEISVFATHPVFSVDAPAKLQESLIQHVFVTDTVSISLDKQFKKLIVLSVADMIAKELHRPTSSNNPLITNIA
ncbi:MAG TPA: ribose-phosphate pyrophosphokinase [Candidatus Saccharimonadales bacterium]|nr:ribose-phosphate pyrophosphokinase [Candidatus Saccharimonadales bacterium]